MPSQFFGLYISSSGLSAYQAALNTTANNISNVQTKGYSRQNANMEAAEALRVNAKYGTTGTGVNVVSIKQVRSVYYDTKFWQSKTSLGLYETKLDYLKQIENHFVDDNTEEGFTTVLNKMFATLDTLKNNSGDINVRQQFTAQAENFTSYFNSVAKGLNQIQEGVNEEIKSLVQDVNSIGKKISLLNKQINIIELQGGYANELRDQRNLLVDELSAIVPIEVKETPVTNTHAPDMQLGSNYYTVKINGQTFVDTYDYYELTCVAREQKVNQSDSEGLYDIRWAHTGSIFNAGADSNSGSLKALFDIRDGNNKENFSGQIYYIEKSQKITITNPSITDVNAMTMPENGALIVDGKNFEYDDFTYEVDENGKITKYIFTLSDVLSVEDQSKINDRIATVGLPVDAKGIPYYMAQMNEFLRCFASRFNEIMDDGVDLNGNKMEYSFFTASDIVTGEQYDFEDSSANGVFSAKDYNSYYKMTCGNIQIHKTAIKYPDSLATQTYEQYKDHGVDKYDLIEKLAALKSDVVIYRGGTASDFLQCVYSDISVDTQEASLFYDNFLNITNTIDNQRMSISGVDEDEEALDLVKFQNAYNLSSKMVSVLAQIYNRLILETGV